MKVDLNSNVQYLYCFSRNNEFMIWYIRAKCTCILSCNIVVLITLRSPVNYYIKFAIGVKTLRTVTITINFI